MRRILLLLLTALSLSAQQLPPSLERGIDILLKQNYQEGARYLQSGSLHGADSLYFTVLLANAELVDYESYNNSHGERFITLTLQSEKTLLTFPLTPLTRFYRAMIIGERGACRIKRGETLGGAFDGKTSGDQLVKIATEFPQFAPATANAAIYRYYQKTVLAPQGKRLTVATEQAALIEKGVTTELSSSYLTAQSLIWIYLDNRLFTQAERLITRLLLRYPTATPILRAKIKLFKECGRLAETQGLAKEFMERATARTPQNWADRFYGIRTIIEYEMKHDPTAGRARGKAALALVVPSEDLKIGWVVKHRAAIASLIKP